MRSPHLIAALLLSLAGNAAHSATVLDINNWAPCVGFAACAVGGASITASGVMDTKNNNGATGLGIQNGTAGEIDIGETLNVTLGAPSTVTLIRLLFLYNGPEYNDKAEIAQITADNVAFTLTLGNLLDDTSAAWSGSGSVSNCGATINQAGGTGCFEISNPFATPVQLLSFTSLNGGPGFNSPGTNNSDYAIGRIDAERSQVPEPGTLALLGLGLLGLGAARRRKTA